MDSRKFVYQETAVIAIGQAICVSLMLIAYALLGRFGWRVVAGGLMGALLAIGNFFFMGVGVMLASDKAVEQDVKRGQALVRNSYMLRLLVLFVLLAVCAKSGFFDLIALVLPLVFVRPIITIAEFFRKKGDTPA